MKLPAVAIRLVIDDADGYFMSRSIETSVGTQFYLYVQRNDEGEVNQHTVCDIRTPRYEPTSWNIRSSADILWRIEMRLPQYEICNDAYAIMAYTTVIDHAARYMLEKNQALTPQIESVLSKLKEREAEREAEQKAYRERREAERIAYNLKREAELKQQTLRAKFLHEQLIWMIGDQIRLTRDGYRSTVFGTIDVVTPDPETAERTHVNYYRIHITTEKKKHMTINMMDINKLDIKHDDAKQFQKFYIAGDEGVPTAESEPEVQPDNTTDQRWSNE